MILQALNQYYDTLVEAGTLERPGWQPVKVSYALQIDDEGNLKRILPLLHAEERGKKKVLLPQMVNVPAQKKKSSGIDSNFLCENSSYFLGIDNKGKPERALKCFQACKEHHLNLLDKSDFAPARAVVQFFRRWNPKTAYEQENLKPYLEEITAGVNLIFDYRGSFVQDYREIQELWNTAYVVPAEGEQLRCLVTGSCGSVARLHPSIKGVTGGQSSGTSLVSFNADAFESFGRYKEQGYNAPVSEKAAFAYTAALNYLIATDGHHLRLSDTTIVFWAEHGEDAYADGFIDMMSESNGVSEEELFTAFKELAAGRKTSLNRIELNPDEHFYILGLAPNAARLSVRFFLQDSFGKFAENLLKHHEYLRIVKPSFDTRVHLSFWQILNETVNQKSRDKMPSPLLAGSLMRSVLMGQPYPRLLLDQVEIRIRADREINRARAAIIKAYLLKQPTNQYFNERSKEALQVELNESTTYQPYLLGRLFAVLENLQETANPGINTTIRDKYFNSACATPAVVFPILLRLAQAHMKKLGGGLEQMYKYRIKTIYDNMNQSYPARLNLYDQGIFQIGYYHQTQARYTKKEEK